MKRKLYKCKYETCNVEAPILSKGYCAFHRSLQKGTPTKKYYLSQQSAKTKERKRLKTELMKPFWEYHLSNMKRIGATCVNCGVRLQCSVANIAHIIPKQSNVELMDDVNNAIYLCGPFEESGLNCHAKFDRIQNTSQVHLMPCWTSAVEHYKLFRSKVEKYTKSVEVFEQWLEENP